MEDGEVSGVVLVTGGTGFLGTQVCLRLIKNTQMDIIAFVRASDHEAACIRLSRAWHDWPELEEQVGKRVKVLSTDITAERFGLTEEEYADLVGRTTHIIHSAADMRLNGPIEELRRTNVGGVRNILQLARDVHADHGLVRLSHVSTAYVAGGRTGEVPEDSLTDEYLFSSRYELTKFEGEQLVKEAKAELPISVMRPGLIVGDSRTGAIKNFNTLYYPLKLYVMGKLKVLPARPSLKVNLIPVDYVAESVVRLTLDPRAEGMNFHLTAPYEDLPSAKELMEFVREWAWKDHGIKVGKPRFFPMTVGAAKGRYKAQQILTHEKTGMFEQLRTLAPYFNERRRFLRDNTDRLLGKYELKWHLTVPPMMDFAIHMSFMHRTDRTVHEQLLFRLKSKSLPVRYHDVYEGELHHRDSREVRQQMLAVAGALKGMGVGPGDRVAMVGLNSSRFVINDVGIGLSGAAGVPMYYTSPPQEIDQILKASGAKVLLVGTPKLLERLGELTVDIPVVSFCRKDPEMGHTKEVIRWEEFLAMGRDVDMPETASVDLNDLATIRYTSGTTGMPKGVTFNHENLRWNGTAVASFLDWDVRTKHIKYLSFLPMNHVVEGISAAYGPYYAPCALDIYFLEDFRDLQDALRMVHPNIFFAVPRFYEKVWEGLQENKMGQRYLRSQEGIKKNILRRLLHKGLLKKVGLDKAVQMFAGSAPIGEDLVAGFQELGIEVHNAYGLTEAPVVTVNYKGRNRVGTVGEPLPETEVLIAEDEEILVRGPQVTPGYFDPDTPSPLSDGWLMTGDLGFMTPEGSMVIHGRKKELIVTSYGKNIHPVAIETLLRDIQGVDEVMVVGDARPYCTALVWTGREDDDPGTVTSINEAMMAVNERVSNPEQIKKWAVLKNDLTIDGGDLTASLKLKRREVTERFALHIAALYGEGAPPTEGVLYLGGEGRGK